MLMLSNTKLIKFQKSKKKITRDPKEFYHQPTKGCFFFYLRFILTNFFYYIPTIVFILYICYPKITAYLYIR